MITYWRLVKTINEKGLFIEKRGLWIPPHKIVKIEFDEYDYRNAKTKG